MKLRALATLAPLFQHPPPGRRPALISRLLRAPGKALAAMILAFVQGWNRLFRSRFSVVKRLGCWFLVDQNNRLERHLLAQHIQSRALLKRAAAEINHRGIETFIDVGANFGLFSVYLNRHCALKKTLAFEPLTELCDKLRVNLILNGIADKVTLHPFALSDAERSRVLYIRPNNLARSRFDLTTLKNSSAGKFTSRRTIACHRFDSLFKLKPASAFIKIDVEGHGPDVLRGMKNFLTTSKAMVLLERDSTTEEIDALLTSFAFRLYRVWKSDFIYVNS